MSEKSQKTEQPTQRRIEKARREGQFFSARQFLGAVQYLAFVAIISAWGTSWFRDFLNLTRSAMKRSFAADLGPGDLVVLSRDLLMKTFLPLVEGGAVLTVLVLALQLGSTKMGLSVKKLTPDFKRLSPLSKLRQLPRQNIPALVQAVVMLPIFGSAIYFIARDNFEAFLGLPLRGLTAGIQLAGASIQNLLWKACGAFLVFGLVDLVRQRRLYTKDLRMSKQEIRDEVRELEGNPQIKARIRRLRRDLLRRKMMREVPTATAVIVNPTHFAVALRYTMHSMAAPVVVAKGKNYLALRIRQMAIEHQVPIVENPPLAQALYKNAEVGQEIPGDLYRAVAEVLAYIYRLMHGRLPA
jgi:flagellar biosynthesis protein FlhB